MSTESHNPIDQVAGDWFARRESGEWSAADQDAFDRWLNETPLHRVGYLRIEHVWERAERLKALRGPAGEAPPPGKWVLSPFFDPGTPGATSTRDAKSKSSKRLLPGIRYVAIAASLALAVAVGFLWYFSEPGSYYHTPVGGLESVPIADGSRVTLNTDTAVRVSVTRDERGVELERGEAFFEVAKDLSRPFIVNAGRKRVIAVGTQFSVLKEGDDVRVIVAEGTVKIEDRAARSSPASAQSPPSLAGPGSTEAVLLPAGSVAHAGVAGVLVQEESAAEAEESLSWRSGVLVFHDMTLADAVAEFNRYNTRQIVINDPALAGLRIAGNFRATNVDAFVRLLEHGYPLRVEQLDDQVVLRAR